MTLLCIIYVVLFIFLAGIVDIYVGGEQPHQRTTTGNNVLHTSVITSAQKMSS